MLLRFFFLNAVMGAAFGVAFAAALLLADVHGLGSLVARTIGLLPGFGLLAALFAAAFGAIAAATAVMLLERAAQNGERPGGAGLMPARLPMRLPMRLSAPSQRGRV